MVVIAIVVGAALLGQQRFKRDIESPEHMLQMMHAGRFFPGRGLAEGKLNNFWETAEPIAFYE